MKKSEFIYEVYEKEYSRNPEEAKAHVGQLSIDDHGRIYDVTDRLFWGEYLSDRQRETMIREFDAGKQYYALWNSIAFVYDPEKLASKNEEGIITAEGLLEELAERDLDSAIFQLGSLYAHNANEATREKGMELIRKAVDRNDIGALNLYGSYLLTGFGVEKDYREARKMFLKSARQGAASAYNNLGCIYEDAMGVEENTAKAIRYYIKGVRLGDRMAQLNLTNLSQRDEVTKKQYEELMQKEKERNAWK